MAFSFADKNFGVKIIATKFTYFLTKINNEYFNTFFGKKSRTHSFFIFTFVSLNNFLKSKMKKKNFILILTGCAFGNV